MKKEIADKWIEALESGKYKQTDSVLERNGSFCCLGVLCKLAEEEGVVERQDNGHTVYYGRWSAELPPEVVEWAGMAGHGGQRKGCRRTLVYLNDTSRYSFQSIAKVIRKEYEDL
jgi:hypothetical protein